VGVSGELERMGPTGFQDLAACLAVAHFGPGVQFMGAGRDGGRDLYYRGQLKDASRDIDGEAASRRKARLQRLTRIKKVRVWDGNQVHALLNLHAAIRDAFPGFLTAGDAQRM
jgi:hypothetical protein